MSDKPELQEIASVKGGRDITRGYVDALPILPPTDPVLAARGGNLAIYDEVLQDDMVKSCLEQRALALTATGWRVVPGAEDRASHKAADFLKATLERLDLDGITKKMLTAVFYGYAVAECLWASDGGLITLDRIKVRKQRRFAFAPDGSLKLLTTSNPMGEPLPERKFWRFACGADDDDEPYGRGLASWLYWPVFFKRGGIQAWTAFLDKFAQPTVVGEFPPGTSEEEKRRLLEAIAAVQSQAGIRIPQGMVIRLLEASRSGRADYGDLPQLMNAAIARVILTQTMTTSDGSSLSQAQVHADMLNAVVMADGNLISNSFNNQVAAWLTAWNFPNATPPRLVFVTDKPEDLTIRAAREKTIAEMTGLKPTQKHIEATYGGEWEPKAPAAPTEKRAIADAPKESSFAEPQTYPDQEALDALDPAKALQGAAKTLLQPLLDKIQGGAMSEDIWLWLGEAYPLLDDAALTELLDRALFTAETWGRISAQREALDE
ncbi:MAG: DUF935 family protein [Magnetococcales bacterium]|nr:DUF935 family protein [Magnetococcales bacterium]